MAMPPSAPKPLPRATEPAAQYTPAAPPPATPVEGVQALKRGRGWSDLDREAKKSALGSLVHYVHDDELDEGQHLAVEQVASLAENYPPPEEWAAAARAGSAARGWYADTSRALFHLFGPRDAPRFIALAAATSPRTGVEPNLRKAVRIWDHYQKKLLTSGHALTGTRPSYDEIRAWLADTRKAGPPAGRVIGPNPNFATHDNAIATALSADPDALVEDRFTGLFGKGAPKIDSFRRNLLAHLGDAYRDAVTNDLWMGNFSGEDPRNLADHNRYIAHSARVRQAAALLNSELRAGEKAWTPAEVQETVWSFQRTLAKLLGNSQRGGRRGMSAREALGLLCDGHVADSPTYLELIAHDDEIGKLIAGLGPEYARRLAQVRQAYRSGPGRGPVAPNRVAAKGTLDLLTPAAGRAARKAGGFKFGPLKRGRGGRPRRYTRFPWDDPDHPGETASQREAREGREAFDRGEIGVHDFVHAQPAGFEHRTPDGRRYRRTIDGVFALTELPVGAVNAHAIGQAYRNPKVVEAYREGYRTHPDEVQPVEIHPDYDRGRSLNLRDGHHRLDAARAEGRPAVRAWVLWHPHQPDPTTRHPYPRDGRNPDRKARRGRRLDYAANIFASGNTDEGLQLPQAAARLHSGNQKVLRQVARSIYQALGVKGYKLHDAVGDWQDGAEPSLAHVIDDPIGEDDADYAAAWFGLHGNQKSVLRFTEHPQGEDSLYQFTLPTTSLAEARGTLSRFGIPFRTLLPARAGTHVLVFDPGRQLRPQVSALSGTLNATVRESTGRGRFLGDGSDQPTRTAARREYRRVIDAYESRPAPAGGPVRPRYRPQAPDPAGAAPAPAGPPRRFARAVGPRRGGHAPFQRAVVEGRHDEGPSQVYADWLDEQGDMPSAMLAEHLRGWAGQASDTRRPWRGGGARPLMDVPVVPGVNFDLRPTEHPPGHALVTAAVTHPDDPYRGWTMSAVHPAEWLHRLAGVIGRTSGGRLKQYLVQNGIGTPEPERYARLPGPATPTPAPARPLAPGGTTLDFTPSPETPRDPGTPAGFEGGPTDALAGPTGTRPAAPVVARNFPPKAPAPMPTGTTPKDWKTEPPPLPTPRGKYPERYAAAQAPAGGAVARGLTYRGGRFLPADALKPAAPQPVVSPEVEGYRNMRAAAVPETAQDEVTRLRAGIQKMGGPRTASFSARGRAMHRRLATLLQARIARP